MREYCLQREVCRSRYLIEYFGGDNVKDCGSCDVCRSRRSQSRSFLKNWLAGHPDWTRDELQALFADPANSLSASDLETFRDLLDF